MRDGGFGKKKREELTGVLKNKGAVLKRLCLGWVSDDDVIHSLWGRG